MEHGIGFDGSNYGYAMVDNSDMVFIPDLATGIVDPYVQIPTLSFVGDVMVIQQPHNRPFAQYPRNVARRAVAYMQETGIADEMIIGPEYEYHMFDALRYQVEPNRMGFALESSEAAWSAGDPAPNSGFHCGAHGGYHIDQPFDLNFDIRNRTCLQLAKYGIDVKYHHHEVGGAGQMEMTRLADDTMTIKYVIRNEAVRAGKTATLMPKPLYGQPGNGMHVHMLLKKDGEYIFYDKDGYAMLSQTAMYFIGGLLTHIRSLCGFTNPSTNSYKRLVPGFEAPVTIGFAMANRSAAIRIPAYAKEPSKKRFDLQPLLRLFGHPHGGAGRHPPQAGPQGPQLGPLRLQPVRPAKGAAGQPGLPARQPARGPQGPGGGSRIPAARGRVLRAAHQAVDRQEAQGCGPGGAKPPSQGVRAIL